MPTTNWFEKIPNFRAEIIKQIDEFELDIQYIHSIRLQDVSGNLGKIIGQIKRWGKILSRLEKFNSHLVIELEEIDAELYINLKKEMILEQDDRKKKKLKIYDIKSEDVKRRMRLVESRQRKVHQLAEMQSTKNYIETTHYWPANKGVEVLKAMAKFSIANEKDYNKIT